MAHVDVAAWLRSLGLERYAEAFRANDIDADVLPELTAEDLIGLGVTSIGHRRKLLAAIAAGEPRPARALAPPPTAAHEAERRQLTVMFVDLVGSTALSGRLDPEDMAAVIRAYQDACAGVITRFEGHVAKYMGDGVLAYFGYPQAREDAAERAVRAGLALVEAVGKHAAPGGEPLAARVGIATGLVVVGELIGEGAAREEAVVGETPNLAARLQALAQPGQVVVAEGTRRLLGGLFALEELAPQAVKGIAAPVQASRVLGEPAAESRFEAWHDGSFVPLVGREQELALLLTRWRLAKEGEGQVVLLSGEPGIGKSRLLRALREQLGDEPHTPLHYQCSSCYRNTALYPVIDQLERAAGFQRDDTTEAKLNKLEELLAEGANRVEEMAPLVADLLAVPTGGRYPPLTLSPQRQKARTLEVLVERLAGLAAKQPVLAVLEDAHWSDPTSLELFGLVIERVQRLPVLLIVTFRPEFQPPWTDHAHAAPLSLNRLGRPQVPAMAERVTGGKPLPAEVVEQIVAKTDGVPLFVEELTKAVLESGLLREEGDRYELAGPLPPLAIPATLQDSLMARLDRLAPVKTVAQVAAVIGREFSYELLAVVAPLSEAELREALDRLVEAELVFPWGTPPEASYSFKHALVQDAAYSALLRSRRQQLHARIAQVLEQQFPETTAAAPEVLAQHLTAAGLAVEAAPYWLRAARNALQRSAPEEALGHLTSGLDPLQHLSEDDDIRARLEAGLQTTLGLALAAARGYGAPEVERAYTRAHELCRRIGEAPQLFPVLYGLFVFHFIRGNLRLARDLGERLLALAARSGDPAFVLVGHSALGHVLFHIGDNSGAVKHLGEAHARYDPETHASLAFTYGHDIGVVALDYLAFARCVQGYADEALRTAQEAVALARRLRHPHSLCAALAFHADTTTWRGDLAAALRSAEECMAVAGEQGFPFWLAKAMIYRGWALAQLGEAADGIDQIRRGIARLQAAGTQLAFPLYLALLAESQLAARRAEEALGTTDEALEWVARNAEGQLEGIVRCARGDALLALGAVDRAEAEYRHARGVARRQQARWWELRAATRLARLWSERGKRTEARDLLAPVYAWFTEGFDVRDLQDAKALLDALGETSGAPVVQHRRAV